jgi:hypothetical protein
MRCKDAGALLLQSFLNEHIEIVGHFTADERNLPEAEEAQDMHRFHKQRGNADKPCVLPHHDDVQRHIQRMFSEMSPPCLQPLK